MKIEESVDTADRHSSRSAQRSTSPAAAPPRPAPPLPTSPTPAPQIEELPLDSELRARAAQILLHGATDEVHRRQEAELNGLDPERDYVPFRARPDEHTVLDQLASEFDRCNGAGPTMPMAEEDGDLIGLLPARPVSVRGATVGLGPPRPAVQLADAFHLATRAVDVAEAFDLAGVHEFSELGLLPVIVADTDLGESLRARFVEPVRGRGRGRDDGRELLTVVDTWFAQGMHVDAVAEQLCLHANTVRNRLARFERLTSVDLRDTGDALQVWWALRAESRTGCRPSDPS